MLTLESIPKKNIKIKKTGGSQCSVSGSNYEKKIHKVVRHCIYNNKPFNTQKEDELAGSSSKNDIECNCNKEKDTGIEIKKSASADMMQSSLTFNTTKKCFEPTENSKNPIACREEFNLILEGKDLYGGEIPPFMERSITYEEWLKIKSETKKWNDIYINIPSNTIKNLYRKKGCSYIQIYGYGLYHLGNDICNFGVPEFNVEQKLRIRIKIHTRKNKKGFCDLSVTAACKLKNEKQLTPSNYSLDDVNKLPPSLIYKC